MAFSEITGTETITTTQWSLATDTSYSEADAQTTEGIYQLVLDVSAVTAIADLFELKFYDDVISGATQGPIQTYTFGPQTDSRMIFPSMHLHHGWDMTLDKLTGTDRSITWSIRGVIA